MSENMDHNDMCTQSGQKTSFSPTPLQPDVTLRGSQTLDTQQWTLLFEQIAQWGAVT